LTPITDITDYAPGLCRATSNLTVTRDATREYECGSNDLQRRARLPDPRLVTIRRRGTLAYADHHLLAVWAADCTEHVLHYFEQARPGDERPWRAMRRRR